jgi:hypothetical protein
VTIDQSFIYQFQNNLELALQKMQSRLLSTVSVGTYQGEQTAPVEYLQPIEAQEITSRNEQRNPVDTAYERRWLKPRSFDWGAREHHLDKLKSAMMSPTSQLSLEATAGLQRRIDKLIAGSFYSTALTGKVGDETKVFDTNNVVAVDTGAGAATTLNLEKLRAGLSLLVNNQVQLGSEPVYLYATIRDVQALQRDVEANFGGNAANNMFASLYSTGTVTVEGVNIVIDTDTTNIPLDGSGYRRLPLYTSKGMHYGYFGNGAIRVDVTRPTHLRGYMDTFDVYAQMAGNATRIDEKRVIEVKCTVPV